MQSSTAGNRQHKQGKLDNRDLIACVQNDSMEWIVNNGRPVHKGMADEDGCLCTERSNLNWAKEKLPEQVFADAVMDISNGGPQMDNKKKTGVQHRSFFCYPMTAGQISEEKIVIKPEQSSAGFTYTGKRIVG